MLLIFITKRGHYVSTISINNAIMTTQHPIISKCSSAKCQS